MSPLPSGSGLVKSLHLDPSTAPLSLAAIHSLSEEKRTELLYALVHSLPTHRIASIVQKLKPLLHIDFVDKIPAEITVNILSYLDLPTLLTITTLSKSWRALACDTWIWKQLFLREGWKPDLTHIAQFELYQAALEADRQKERQLRIRRHDVVAVDESEFSPKKRSRSIQDCRPPLIHQQQQQQQQQPQPQPQPWVPLLEYIQADSNSPNSSDLDPNTHHHYQLDIDMTHSDSTSSSESEFNDTMQDVIMHTQPPLHHHSNSTLSSCSSASTFSSPDPHLSLSSATTNTTNNHPTSLPPPPLWPAATPSLLLTSPNAPPRVNWLFLYKQRLRLERNWRAGRFKNFQLPHPSRPHEAHTECVYTIQYLGKHLVSGSRDQTLRIWDLETQRLHAPPLRAHTASVLCLQFDPSPEQDILISAGSDCSIIIWKFSTASLLRVIHHAHRDPILNLKFDHRYLVTCSKDQTIKVWSRIPLHPLDDDYPKPSANTHHSTNMNLVFPDYIYITSPTSPPLIRDYSNDKILPPYTLLMTLYGHTAAVNAIQILNDTIVSASGDRFVKMWNIKTGDIVRTIQGHGKGIACVQYDGKRIVSGSSDESIHIYDAATGSQAATLKGHEALVRTIQAAFVDNPDSESWDDNVRRANERAQLLEMRRAEKRKHSLSANTNVNVNAAVAATVSKGTAFHSKLPSGGGGGQWARIVSGSYDESIIVWKRNNTSEWVPAYHLTQWEGIIGAGGHPRFVPSAALNIHFLGTQLREMRTTIRNASESLGVFTNTLTNLVQRNGNGNGNGQHNASTEGGAAVAHGAAATNGGRARDPIRQHFQQLGLNLPMTRTNPVQATAHDANRTATAAIADVHSQVDNSNNDNINNNNHAPPPPTTSGRRHPRRELPTASRPVNGQLSTRQQAAVATTATAPPPPPLPQQQQQQQQRAPPSFYQMPVAAVAPAQPPPHGRRGHRQDGGVGGMMQGGNHNRVYKLQFDTRRLIACSQDPVIVGWDFANGERDIEIASEFFRDEV